MNPFGLHFLRQSNVLNAQKNTLRNGKKKLFLKKFTDAHT
jgi:hypothetical protein